MRKNRRNMKHIGKIGQTNLKNHETCKSKFTKIQPNMKQHVTNKSNTLTNMNIRQTNINNNQAKSQNIRSIRKQHMKEGEGTWASARD